MKKSTLHSFFLVLLVTGIVAVPLLIWYAARRIPPEKAPLPLQWVQSALSTEKTDTQQYPSVPTDEPTDTALPGTGSGSSVTDTTTDRPSVSDKATDKTSDKTSDKPSDPATDKTTDKTSSHSTDPVTDKTSSDTGAVTDPVPPQDVNFVNVGDDYFDDALFVGDSRTDDYYNFAGPKNADCYAATSKSVYNIWKGEVKIRGPQFKDNPSMSLEALLKSKTYGKIYIMLGINEIGYNIDRTAREFAKTVDLLRALQPDALIFIEGNLHVTKTMSDNPNMVESNALVNQLNAKLAALADGKTVFFVDLYTAFDNEQGAMPEAYTSDGMHPRAKYYPLWTQYLKTKGIVRND